MLSFDLDVQWLRVRSVAFRILYLTISMLYLVSPSTTSSRDTELPVAAIPEGCQELHVLSAELRDIVEAVGQSSHLHTKVGNTSVPVPIAALT